MPNKLKVLYITQVYFLDAALEYINEIKNSVNLSVIVLIDPSSKNSNILDVLNLPEKGDYFEINQILDESVSNQFKKYIEGVNSFKFFVFQSKRSISVTSQLKSLKIFSYIKHNKFDFVHFDDLSIRLIALSFLLKMWNGKVLVNVHDPVQHSGERNIKALIMRKLFYPSIYKFVTFSEYSRKIFLEAYKNMKGACVTIRLKPYLYYKNFESSSIKPNMHVSFVGRVSLYKGVDIFIEAIKLLNKESLNINYIIAGKPVNSEIESIYPIAEGLKNVSLISHHLSNNELVKIIQMSNIIVCPYKDATQSGIIMTCLALKTPLIVTNVGGLPEYVDNNRTGIVCEPNSSALADSIKLMLDNPEMEKRFRSNLSNDLQINSSNIESNKISNLYR